MTKQKIIAAFEQAEKDWIEKVKKGCTPEGEITYNGLCNYFYLEQNLSATDAYKYLPSLWEKYRTREGDFHFNNREERLYAIRQVLNDIKRKVR
jgi:hypothetical protein